MRTDLLRRSVVWSHEPQSSAARGSGPDHACSASERVSCSHAQERVRHRPARLLLLPRLRSRMAQEQLWSALGSQGFVQLHLTHLPGGRMPHAFLPHAFARSASQLPGRGSAPGRRMPGRAAQKRRRGAMAMAMSSWNSSLAAYGMYTCGAHAASGARVLYASQTHCPLAGVCMQQGAQQRWGRSNGAHNGAHLDDGVVRFASSTVEGLGAQVGHGHQAALGAHVHPVRVAHVKEALLRAAAHSGQPQLLSLQPRSRRSGSSAAWGVCQAGRRLQALQPQAAKAAPAPGRPTLRKPAEPWEMMQSRSISPKRRPPSRARPSTGWRVSSVTGPRPREWILSSTMCFSRW